MAKTPQTTKDLQIPGVSSASPRARQAALAAYRADVWAKYLKLQVQGEPFSTKGRKYIVAIMRDNSEEIICKKAAQMGFTVAAYVRAMHKVVMLRQHGLYLLPFKAGSVQFMQSRIDPTINSNKTLKSQFANVANRSHKQTTSAINFYLRGTNIATELREISVDFEIWDEVDKFVTKYLDDAMARMDASKIAQLIQLSTPTAPGVGIDALDAWQSSDQRRWEVPCSHCSRFQAWTFEDNVRLGDSHLDSVLECSYCHKKISDRQRWEVNDLGRWVPTHLDGDKRGYHVNQFNSPTKRFQRIIKGWFDGQSSAIKLRGFYTLNLGEPYAGRGDKFTDKILDDCIVRGHQLRTIPQGPIYVGVDIGNFLHAYAAYLHRGQKVVWDIKIFTKWSDLDAWLSTLHNFVAVVDSQPEKTKAKELVVKYPKRVWLGKEKDNPDQTEEAIFDERLGTVSIDRTMAFDNYIDGHMKGEYVLPTDARLLGEDYARKDYNGYYAHHLEMVRTYVEDSKGKTVVRWVKTKNPDHWHHAGMFCWVAMRKEPPLQIPAGIARAFRSAGSVIGG